MFNTVYKDKEAHKVNCFVIVDANNIRHSLESTQSAGSHNSQISPFFHFKERYATLPAW